MALMFEYKPGMSLSDPWPFTIVRATTAYRFANDGTVKQVAANVLRDNHYPFGLGSAIRTTLFEPTVINRLLQSQTWATAPWAAGTNLTVANAAGVAPDSTSTACSLIPTTTNSASHSLSQSMTITDSEYVAASFFIKASGYNFVRPRVGGAAGQLVMTVNLTTGAITNAFAQNGATLTGTRAILLANGWVWIQMFGKLAVTEVTASWGLGVFDTQANSDNFTAWTPDGTSGVLAWGAQFERNGTGAPKGASSYVPTVAGVVTRNDEKCSTPWPFQTMPMWGYTSWYDLGGSIWLQSAPILTISNNAVSPDPSWCPVFLRNNGKPGASWASGVYVPPNSSGMLGSQRNTIAAAAGLATVQPYDFVETFSRVLIDGSTRFEARINGGTVVISGAVGPTGGIPFPDIINALLFLGWPGQTTGPQIGLTCARIGADPLRITTLAQAAAA